MTQRVKNAEDEGNIVSLVKAEREQSFLLVEYHQFKESLMEDYPQYVAVREIQNSAHAENAAVLPEESCYINVTFVKNSPLVFAWTKDALKEIQLSDTKDIAEKCSLYRELLAYGSSEAMQDGGKYLWALPDGSYRVVKGRQMPCAGRSSAA